MNAFSCREVLNTGEKKKERKIRERGYGRALFPPFLLCPFGLSDRWLASLSNPSLDGPRRDIVSGKMASRMAPPPTRCDLMIQNRRWGTRSRPRGHSLLPRGPGCGTKTNFSARPLCLGSTRIAREAVAARTRDATKCYYESPEKAFSRGIELSTIEISRSRDKGPLHPACVGKKKYRKCCESFFFSLLINALMDCCIH